MDQIDNDNNAVKKNSVLPSEVTMSPESPNLSNRINYEEIRAIADSKSLNYRFSNKNILKKYEPDGNISKKLYKISEKIRCE